MVDDLDGGLAFDAFEADATIEFLLKSPIPPSCRKANESMPLGFVVLEGRGGGVLLPAVRWLLFCDV